PGAAMSPRYAAFFLSLGMWGHGYDPTKNGASRYYEIRAGDPKLGTGTWHPMAPGPLTSPLPVHLAPLEALKQKMLIISGLSTLTGDPDGTNATHSLPTSAWLTSGYKRTGNNGTTPPDSVDQFIANAMGFTPGSTIAFNPSASDFSESTGGHGGYVSSNSRLGGNHLVPKVTDPMKVFTQLFGKCATAGSGASQMASLADDKSVLDYVMGSVTALEKNLGKDDSARLDAYLQNIRDVENSLTTAAPVLCPTTPPGFDPVLDGGATDWLAKLRMMVDVVALAMASDAMPIATIMTDTEAHGDPAYAARVAYASDFMGVNGNKVTYSSSSLDTHTDITHAAFAPRTQIVEEWFAYTRVLMYVAQRLALKLDSFPVEPNGNTPLDNSLLQIGCCHSHATDHTTHNLPVILLGGKKLNMHQGQYVQVPMNTDLGNFYYTMLHAMQVPGTDFNGNSTLLSGLFG
ncbi:MAG TPA: DUF1552 domain-containing protein, partial [Polyangiaceae bacterium]|nr:DUF1552 domain-containing protein [Polyangiaceae bacterium]